METSIANATGSMGYVHSAKPGSLLQEFSVNVTICHTDLREIILDAFVLD